MPKLPTSVGEDRDLDNGEELRLLAYKEAWRGCLNRMQVSACDIAREASRVEYRTSANHPRAAKCVYKSRVGGSPVLLYRHPSGPTVS